MRDLLYRLGFSYPRPTYSLSRVNKEKQEVFKEQFETLKKLMTREFEHLLLQDESSIRDYQSLVSNWLRKGKQRIIPTYGINKSIKLIGVLNYEIRRVYV